MAIDAMQSPSFKGYYKVVIPNVKEAKNEQEKNAYTDLAINTVVMGYNMSAEAPRVSSDKKAVYYNIKDVNDKYFEYGFNEIVNDCNKNFNVDLAKKAYIQKVDAKEFNSAQSTLKE